MPHTQDPLQYCICTCRKRFADGAVGGRLKFATHDSQLTSAQLGNLWLKTMWIDYFEIAQINNCSQDSITMHSSAHSEQSNKL